MADAYKVIRGGRLIDHDSGSTTHRDVLINGRRIVEVGPPGARVPESAVAIDATDRLLIPGWVNAHTHGHGSLSKGMGDLWSVELLLNAGPWISAQRSLEGHVATFCTGLAQCGYHVHRTLHSALQADPRG